jgi:hypothetical protein
MKPLEISFWYWHTPYKIEAAEAAQLQAIEVKQLFVLAGTFKMQHDAVHMVMPQQWETATSTFGVHLVFHIDSTLIREFEKLPVETLAQSLGTSIYLACDNAARSGVRVVGVQLDFDCPTRLLERFGDLMHRLRPKLRHGLQLSATALPTWYTSSSVDLLMKQVDFLTPQYYEPTISKTVDGTSTISSVSLLQHGLKAAGRHDYPFYAGIPAYGHALLYTDKGDLLGMYHDMSVTAAMQQPAFRLDRSFGADREAKPATSTNYVGEDMYDFEAVRPDEDGHGLGFHLVYDIPTPELLRSYMAALEAERPRNCRGVILFRCPEANEPSTLPITAIAATLAHRKPAPNLKVSVSSTAAPWAVVESGMKVDHVPHDVMITVTNTGDAATFIAKDAVTVYLQFDSVGFDTIEQGDFDSAETLYSYNAAAGSAVKASSLRSNTIRAYRCYLAPGETARIGPIETQAANVHGKWSVIGAGKLQTYRGEIPEQAVGDH